MPQQQPSTSATHDGRLWALNAAGDAYVPVQLDAQGKLPVAASVTAGNSTIADGGDVAQGAKADAKATDATSAWSVISLLKGIWYVLSTLTVTVSATIAGTSTLTNTADNAASVTVLAANALRLGAILYNDSSAAAYVKFGATASSTSFTRKLLPQDCWDISDTHYSGKIDAIWTSAPGGALRVTELTA